MRQTLNAKGFWGGEVHKICSQKNGFEDGFPKKEETGRVSPGRVESPEKKKNNARPIYG